MTEDCTQKQRGEGINGRYVQIALIAGASLLWQAQAFGGDAVQPPNILFVATDDLRVELGAYGQDHVISPHIDSVAARGVRFNRAYCQQAVCNPSRASALTGLRPERIGVIDLHTRFRETMPEAVTIPQHFKQHGYYTQSIGKIFHNDTSPVPEGVPPHEDPQSWSVEPVLNFGPHWKDDPTNPERKGAAWQRLDVPDEAYFDGMIGNAAVEAIEERAVKDEPFFLAVGFWKPHLPFNAPKRYWDLYDPDALPPLGNQSPPRGVPDIALHDYMELRYYQGTPLEGPVDPELAAHLRHGYYASISFLDAQLGKILNALEDNGLADNTIIVFWSDHGFHLGENDLWAKTSNYELDARVPLIFAGPGVDDSGLATDALVELVDLFPTLADLSGLPVPGDVDGVSLEAVLANPQLPGKPYALTQYPHPPYNRNWTAMGYALRTDRYRYVEWVDRDDPTRIVARELYDHQNDPSESVNLAGDAEMPGILQYWSSLRKEAYSR